MAIITRTGKFKTNKCGDQEPEEKTTFFKGETTAEGRLKLYEKLEAGDKVSLEAGDRERSGGKKNKEILKFPLTRNIGVSRYFRPYCAYRLGCMRRFASPDKEMRSISRADKLCRSNGVGMFRPKVRRRSLPLNLSKP